MAKRKSFPKLLGMGLIVFAALYFTISYVVAPSAWFRYDRRHPALENLPGMTYTGAGIPADPVNLSLVGTKAEVVKAMLAAQWYPADELSLRSCLEIAEATVLKRPYDDAPVSSAYLFDRKEDLAFEQPVGDNPRQRHHVRLWQSKESEGDRPVWLGAATYDERVGLSRTTGQITHLTAADIDAERDHLMHDLEQAHCLSKVDSIDDFHKVRQGRNGEGEPWHTDGRLLVGVINPAAGK